MSGRYVIPPDGVYCLNPQRVFVVDNWIVVPCGKCAGCLVHKANQWSMRLGSEIDSHPFNIFFTLTYSNKYYPTLVKNYDNKLGLPVLLSDHSFSIRNNGVSDVRRKDGISIRINAKDDVITNALDWQKTGVIGYMSKRDVQLFLKNLRKFIYEKFCEVSTFRYYIISECGPTTRRWHSHGILFFDREDISSFAKEFALYQSWQMCDQALFDEHTCFCNSGTRNYLTQYITCVADLPSVYKEPEIKPFRLASKNPSIGYFEFDKTEVQKQILGGNDEFVRSIKRLDMEYIFSYAKDYRNRLFPKCYQYRKFDFSGLCGIYGFLYFLVRKIGYKYDSINSRLSKVTNPSTLSGMRACYQFCVANNCPPEVYVFALQQNYYLQAMSALRYQYEEQIRNGFTIKQACLYDNFSALIGKYRNLSLYSRYVIDKFCEPLGLVPSDINEKDLRDFSFKINESYARSVSDVLNDMVKLPKFNELTNQSPHIV